MIVDRWNLDGGGEPSPLSETRIHQSICKSFMLDVLIGMTDRFASHFTLFRLLFSNLVDRDKYRNEVANPLDEELKVRSDEERKKRRASNLKRLEREPGSLVLLYEACLLRNHGNYSRPSSQPFSPSYRFAHRS